MPVELFIPDRDAAEPKPFSYQRIPYSPLDVAILRTTQERRMLTQLSKERREHFERMRATIPRVETNLPQGHRQYDGPWYRQVGPTCVPSTLQNGMHVINVDLPEACFAQMLNQALDLDNKGVTGTHTLKMSEILLSTAWINVDAVASLNYVRTFDPNKLLDPAVIAKHRTEYNALTDPIRIRNSHNQFSGIEKMLWGDIRQRLNLRYTATKLKNILDQGQAAILSILNYPQYTGINIDAGHEICLAGYDINNQSHMDIQIIDSNWGHIWTSLEHINSSFTKEEGLWPCFALQPM